MNAIEAALIGGLVGALIVSGLGALLAWRQGQHDLRVRMLEHRHLLHRAALEDAARLRDARYNRLRDDARELAGALFDLERLALLMQWGESADEGEMRRLELSARARFEAARAGLTLDPDGVRLTATFESLTGEIAKYQSMLQSHRVLVEARAVQQAVDHADEMEAQRARVVDGITAALRETQVLLESVAVPVQAPPPAAAARDEAAASERAGDEAAGPAAAEIGALPESGLPVGGS